MVLHVKYFGASATSSAFQNDLDRFKAASLHVSVFLLVDRQAALHPGQHLDVALRGADAAAVRDSSHGGWGEGRGPGHLHLHCQQPGRLHQRVHHRHGAAGTDSQVQTPLTTACWGALRCRDERKRQKILGSGYRFHSTDTVRLCLRCWHTV